jgi:hypothetical protein
MPGFPLKTVAGQLTAYLAVFMLALFWIVSGTPRSWSLEIPDAAHTYGIRFGGGTDLFFRPSIGWFVEHGVWVFVGLAIAALAVDLAFRRRW